MQEIVKKKRSPTLKARVAELEAEVADLKRRLEQLMARPVDQPFKHDWEKTFGIFKDDPTHEEAVRLGQAWRRRQPKC